MMSSEQQMSPDKTKILTVPERITPDEITMITGNEYISLPEISLSGDIKSLNILRLDHLSLLEFRGTEENPLISPFLKVNDLELNLSELLAWSYDFNWIPLFKGRDTKDLIIDGKIIAPPGIKGFIYSLTIQNNSSKAIAAEFGWRGFWDSFNMIVFSRRRVDGSYRLAYNSWTESLVMEASTGLPQAALAFSALPDCELAYDCNSKEYSYTKRIGLEPEASETLKLFVSANMEEDGAATTNIDMRRRGFETLEYESKNWLMEHQLPQEDPDLEALLNRNLFFNYYYATGTALDREEVVPLTSRSPRYYVSGAFWSRDTLLWSFPAITMVDLEKAGEVLSAVFTRHLRNAGDHAHYFNGTILYPGFELDQLAAYFLSLKKYIEAGGNPDLIQEPYIRKGLDCLAAKAFEHFDPATGLYSTFLDPSDDPVTYPYLTYNNALLQRAFTFLSTLQAEGSWNHKSDFAILAGELTQSIYENCTVKGPFGSMFVWAVDGHGRFITYDNPPGSLQLLAHYGFCSYDDTIYLNTVRWIRSTNNSYFHQGERFEEAGSAHAGNPWPLAACNDLLSCNMGALDFFRNAEMDSGFFCETVDPVTGRVSTGAAFASGAGFLAYSLYNRREEGLNKCRQAKYEERGV